MKIAINTRTLLAGKLEGIGWFTNELVKRMVLNHPEDEFIFYFDRPFDKQFIFAKNITPVLLFPPSRHPILWYWWFEFSLFKAMKKHNPDVLFSSDGYLSLRSKTPTLLAIHDLAVEHFPNHMPWKFRSYLKYFNPKFAKKANRIVTVSEFSKYDIAAKYNIDKNKIDVIYNGAHENYKPLQNEEITEIRKKYAEGNAYFIFPGALHPRKNIVKLLNAFQLFKENDEQEFKLLLVGRFAWNTDEIKRVYENHPYKKDIYLYPYMNVNELSKVIGAAFALTFVSLLEGFGIPILEAMKCKVPSIVANNSSLPEVAGNAAIYVNAESENEISNAMTALSINADLYKDLKEKAALQAQKFSWDESAEKLYNILINIVQQNKYQEQK